MLLYFSLGGFYSFKENQDLFLTAYPKTRLKNTKYEKNFILNLKERVMKSVIIFGGNASGKTNLILGIETIINIILNGINLPKDFNKKIINFDSNRISFEIGIMDKQENIYEYSFKFDENNVIYEKLEFNNKKIFEFDNNILKTDFPKKISSQILKIFSIKSTETIVRKLKDFQIKEIDDFIKNIQNIRIIRGKVFNLEAKEVLKKVSDELKIILEEKKEDVLKILKFLDYTIENFDFEKIGNKDNEVLYEIYFLRNNSNNKFYLGNESEGIKKIMNIIAELLEIYAGKTLIIDELDSSISTLSLIKLFNNFVNIEKNLDGQLIVTSHNLLLFNNNIFEPQQIYIVNKKENLTSELYSLAEFKIRTEKENLYDDFLKGKFGGING